MSGVGRVVMVAGLLATGFCLAGAGAATLSPAQPQGVQIAPPVLGRGVHGTVLNAVHRPLARAVVYLKDVSSKTERAVITGDDGNYTFYDLKKNTTYQVYAVWKGHKSPIRTDSEYNTQTNVRLDLTIPVE